MQNKNTSNSEGLLGGASQVIEVSSIPNQSVTNSRDTSGVQIQKALRKAEESRQKANNALAQLQEQKIDIKQNNQLVIVGFLVLIATGMFSIGAILVDVFLSRAEMSAQQMTNIDNLSQKVTELKEINENRDSQKIEIKVTPSNQAIDTPR